jgi:SNF2 family DNA or RNA helicase
MERGAHPVSGLSKAKIALESAVLSELPPRTEVTLEVDLPAEERAFYEALRRKALQALSGSSEGLAGQRRIHILAEITRLRRACCHPGLVDPRTELPRGQTRDRARPH